MMKYIYWVLSVGSLGMLSLEAPRGELLTSAPTRGKVKQQDKTRPGGATVRRAPMFIWLGGGYHGGK